jgi:hypothetical protein
VVETGPLSPTGWVTYAPYPLFAVWLVATTVVMVRRLGTAPAAGVTRATPGELVDHAR